MLSTPLCIMESLFRDLHVPYTRTYLRKYTDSHPINDSLWAVKKTLDHFGLANQALFVADKTSLQDLPVPFVAQMAGEFIIVRAVSEAEVVISGGKGKPKTVAIEQFRRDWSGVTLLCENDGTASEPDYESHRKANRRTAVLSILTWMSALCLFAVIMTFNADSWPSPVCVLGAVCSIVGVFLSGLLLKNYLHIPSNVAETLCNIVGHGKCDERISQKKRDVRLFGRFDLSEAGIAFFGVNLIGIILFPRLMAAPIAVCTAIVLPFSLWSVFWQWRNLRGWCPLCLTVMLTVWIQFAALTGLGQYSGLEYSNALVLLLIGTGASYFLAMAGLHSLVADYQTRHRQGNLVNSLQRLKYDRRYWNTLLASQPLLDVTGSDASTLVFGRGDEDKPLITIAGNPFCNPCGRMHKRLQPLFEAGFAIQYYYTYFNPDLAPVNRQIVAAYMEYGAERTWDLLNQWYDGNREHHVFNTSGVRPSCKEAETRIIEELTNHDRWIERNGVTSTPTVLIDGRPLPEQYSIEDLMYLY